MPDRAARWHDAYIDLADHLNSSGRHPTTTSDVRGHRTGIDLARWARHQRTLHRTGHLPADRARQLEALPGWTWSPNDNQWQTTYKAVAAQLAAAGRYPQTHHAWITRQRQHHAAGRLLVDRARQLEALPGWTWQTDRWQIAYNELAARHARTGRYPSGQSGIRGTTTGNLGAWLQTQRQHHADGTLPPDRARQLERLPGWTWQPLADAWTNAYHDVTEHHAHTGRYPTQHPTVIGRVSGVDLGQWLKWQRLHHRRGTLTTDRARQLETLPDWTWQPHTGRP